MPSTGRPSDFPSERVYAVARASDARVPPDTIAIAKRLSDEKLVPFPDVVALLQSIDRDHPQLAFADFVRAIHLAYLSHMPGGRA